MDVVNLNAIEQTPICVDRVVGLGCVELPFEPIDLEVLELFRAYFDGAAKPICDYSVGGTFLWIEYSDYQYAIERDTLFISELLPDGRRAYWLPVGAMSLEQSVCRLLEHSSARGETLVLYPVQHSDLERLGRHFVVNGVDNFEGRGDYVHSAAEFANFVGRRYAKKRNHVRRFQSENPDYLFSELTDDQIGRVMIFHLRRDSEGMDDNDAVVALREYENGAVAKALGLYSLFRYDGLVLYSRGEVCGFCFGEVVGDTLFVHAEKCDKSMVGCNQLLASEYVRRMIAKYPNVRWLNREDDMNVPGIRRAKESYHPDRIIDKYIVTLSPDLL
ncbi:MAG: phosphatidylglycerol lysyltransferase domain-containing protein [Rikenellaceae bacterium]